MTFYYPKSLRDFVNKKSLHRALRGLLIIFILLKYNNYVYNFQIFFFLIKEAGKTALHFKKCLLHVKNAENERRYTLKSEKSEAITR